ncbi:extensin family protein [Erythrobacter sp. R86502]|uniref:extensin-like domain-containing protein n=1 Tax=Erythrobacter sp. R86502 TaxID=3093846 RepID=UPI0036D3666B
MNRYNKSRASARGNTHFAAARRAMGLLALLVGVIAGWQWLQSHPQHSPWAPLDLRDPPGWATRTKMNAMLGDVSECRAVLARSDVNFSTLPPTGEGECARPDRTRLGNYPLSPDTPAVTCPVAVALELWRRDSVAPSALAILGSELARIEHLGAYSCRRIYGGADGAWSEHATANAIDIAAFILEDGRRVSVLGDWDGDDPEAAFLRAVRDGACNSFATVLSPEYNAAHADHFHLDQDDRWAGVCR